MFNKKPEQQIGDVQNSTVNQAGGNINIQNGLTYSEVKDLCETTVRAEVARLTGEAKVAMLQILGDFQDRFYARLSEVENRQNLEKLNKPSVQLCVYKTILETSKAEDDELTKDELLEMLIDRLNADEQSTEKVVIEDAIERAARASKPLKALMVALQFRSIIIPGPFGIDDSLKQYGEMFKDLAQLNRLDVAYGRQMQCIFPMTGLHSGYTYEDVLLHNYDLLFRHCGTLGKFNAFAEQYPQLHYGIRMGNFDNMKIVSIDASNGRKVTDESPVFFITPSSEFLKALLNQQGRSDMIPALDALLQTMPPFTHEETRQYLHALSEGWDCVFEVFQRKEVIPLLLSPVGNYMAMAYTRRLGKQPEHFLQEIYNHEQGW